MEGNFNFEKLYNQEIFRRLAGLHRKNQVYALQYFYLIYILILILLFCYKTVDISKQKYKQ